MRASWRFNKKINEFSWCAFVMIQARPNAKWRWFARERRRQPLSRRIYFYFGLFLFICFFFCFVWSSRECTTLQFCVYWSWFKQVPNVAKFKKKAAPSQESGESLFLEAPRVRGKTPVCIRRVATFEALSFSAKLINNGERRMYFLKPEIESHCFLFR